MDSGRCSHRPRPLTVSSVRIGSDALTRRENLLFHASPRGASARHPIRQAGRLTRTAAFAWTLLVLALPAAASAQDQVDTTAAPGSAALDRFLDEVDTFTAEFEQELWSSDQRLLETASGTLSIKRPNRFVWRYEAPIEQLVVADGERLWMFDVDLDQATVTPLESGEAASPAMLLSGEQGIRDSFDIVEEFARDGQDWIRLSPKPGGADFQSVLIGFRDGLPMELEFVDGLDQVTSIVFSGVAVNTELSDALFEFDPPAGVDVIGGEG